MQAKKEPFDRKNKALALMEVAQGERPADLIVRNGKLLNVFTREIYQADVAVFGGRFAAVGDLSHHKASREIDATGMYILPGFVEPHIHVEVSKLSVTRFAELVLPHGTTAVVTGFDQIGAVAGLKGIRSFLDEAKATHLKVFLGVPSKLPYTTPPSTIGSGLGPSEHAEAQRWEESVGTWETTSDFVLMGDEDVLRAMDMAFENRLLPHGHCPLLTGDKLQAYLTTGIRSDHESLSKEEALQKLRSGVYVMIRETPLAPNLEQDIKLITENGVDPRRICLCTDDTTVTALAENGHLDNLARKAVQHGVSPVDVVQMITINPAEAYRIDHLVGSVSAGRIADLVVVEDLSGFRVKKVVASGQLVAEDGSMLLKYSPPERPPWLLNTMRLREIKAEELALRSPFSSDAVRAISIYVDQDNDFYRFRREVKLKVEDGVVLADPSQDVLYVSAVERYSGQGMPKTAFISGFHLRRGAMATTLTPDDDNVICVGADLRDMAFAINHLTRMGGGHVVVDGLSVKAELALPIGGICTDARPEEVKDKEKRLKEAAWELGSDLREPFMAMAFLPITAIPQYAITDKGLVDCSSKRVISPLLGPAD